MDPYNYNTNPYILPSENNNNNNPNAVVSPQQAPPTYSPTHYDHQPFPAPPITDDFQTQQDLNNFYGEEPATTTTGGDAYNNNNISYGQPQQQSSTTSYAGVGSQSSGGGGIKGKFGVLTGRWTNAEEQLIVGGNMSDHKHPKVFVRLTAVMALIMTLCFLIFLLTTPYGYPWFIHVWWLGLISIGVAYISGTKKPLLGTHAFSYHFVISVLTIFMLVLTNEHASGRKGYPWSIYPISILCLALCIHATAALFTYYFNHFHIHVLCWFFGNGIIFLSWCYSHPGKVFAFPWFLFPLAVWTGLLVAHWFLWLFLQRRRAMSQPEQPPVRNASSVAPPESMYSYEPTV